MSKEVYKNILSTTMFHMPIERCHLYTSAGQRPKHISHSVISWLDENQVNVMPWPAQSSDLNPIENLWMMVKRQNGYKIFKNCNDLMIQIEKEWNAIPIE